MASITYFGVTYSYTGWPVFSWTISPDDWVWIVRVNISPGESVHARRKQPGPPIRSELRTREVVAVSEGTDYFVEASWKYTAVCNYDLNDSVEVRLKDGTVKTLPPCSPGSPGKCVCEQYPATILKPERLQPLDVSVADQEAAFDLDSMYEVTVSSGTQLRVHELDGVYHLLGEGPAGRVQVVSKFSGSEEHAPALKPLILGTQAAQWVIGLPYHRQEPLQSVRCAIHYETVQEGEQTLYRVRGAIDMAGSHLWQRAGEEDVRVEVGAQTDVPDYVQILRGERAALQMPSTCFVEVME